MFVFSIRDHRHRLSKIDWEMFQKPAKTAVRLASTKPQRIGKARAPASTGGSSFLSLLCIEFVPLWERKLWRKMFWYNIRRRTQRHTQELNHKHTHTHSHNTNKRVLLICEKRRSAHDWQWKEWKLNTDKMEPSAKTMKLKQKSAHLNSAVKNDNEKT